MPDTTSDDERWLVIDGRRWRRTDPSLPDDVVDALKSHLGRGRSGVRVAKAQGDEHAVAAARKRVGLAKHGLGERGPTWWDDPADDSTFGPDGADGRDGLATRLRRAHEAL